ncbi:hypothetical protein K437DRAFT_253148 [Tilletiaria anomala UBC 951]|uniref:Uncharacterized protein n=1 Tax=Tilletiaria anomala (strain ATCC 24038 / CBS 436.72 / UBC 951) TaxID=1037660 RepID=A0A066WLH9_TILAU|nr:uncharacterized protein K437DRAFT_253148 [Tilletiaria anomala UBC 951]KDN53448.1 hypothetical protein K437DRAFT_253148 [Tilletiaria anomala UBC 951]
MQGRQLLGSPLGRCALMQLLGGLRHTRGNCRCCVWKVGIIPCDRAVPLGSDLKEGRLLVSLVSQNTIEDCNSRLERAPKRVNLIGLVLPARLGSTQRSE